MGFKNGVKSIQTVGYNGARIVNVAEIENQLKKGARKAREISVPYIQKIRNAVGIRKLI